MRCCLFFMILTNIFKLVCLFSISNPFLWNSVIADEELNGSSTVAGEAEGESIELPIKFLTSNFSNFNNENHQTDNNNSMWPIDLIVNYSMSNYFDSIKDNIRFLYHYIMVRCLGAIFLSAQTTAAIQDNDNEINDNGSSPMTILYLMQDVLFRFETLTLVFIFLALSFIIHRRNVIVEPAPPQHHYYHPYSLMYSLDRLLTKVFRFLNFTVVFGNLFSVVDSTFKRYFEMHTIVNQMHHGTAGAYSMQGRRVNMEDCFSLKNNIHNELGIDFYGVFDGHGGPNAALYANKEIFERVSKRILEVISKQKKDSDEKSCFKTKTLSSKLDSCPANHSKTMDKKFELLTLNSIRNILNEEIVNVDKQLVEEFTKKQDIAGTTALIAIRLIHSNKLLVANVGDSRGIICDSKGSVIPLSFDHKPYLSKEYRRILEAGGYISLKGVYRVNGILAISRALGDYPLKDNRLIIPDPDILSFDLNELKPKYMIMASDGFWDAFSNENAILFVNNELSHVGRNEMNADSISLIALKIAKKLAKEAYIRESYDNITVIFVLFNDDYDDKIRIATAKTSSLKSSPQKKTSSPQLKSQQCSTNDSS